MNLKTVIGLEIHVQLKTKSKMFCSCDNNAENAEPNTLVCPVCLGLPGSLPVANKQAIDWVIMTGLALNCEIAKTAKFDRKHYFYPDLPKGYQISQYDKPFCLGGFLKLQTENGETKKIRLRRIHLEEDAGKLIHKDGESLVDLNRAGTPLMEIVTEPDISTPVEAKLFMQKLRSELRRLDVSDADMEKGHLRCDANISIEREGKEGVPVEIKNMNSFKMVERALAYEETRQKDAIENGEKIEKETRGWNDAKGESYTQRSKEHAQDYRYFPEPDLPPFVTTEDQISNMKSQISESLDLAVEKYKAMGIGGADINTLTSNFNKKRYFDELIEKLSTDEEKALAAKWLVNRFFDKEMPAGEYAEFIKKVSNNEIPQTRALEVIKKVSSDKKKVDEVVKELNIAAIDESKVGGIIDQVVAENQSAVDDYKNGKEAALKFLIGQVMAKSKGQIDPNTAAEKLIAKIKEN